MKKKIVVLTILATMTISTLTGCVSQKKYDELYSERESLQEQVEDLEEEIEELKGEVNKQKEDIKTLENELQEAKTEAETYKEKAEKYDTLITTAGEYAVSLFSGDGLFSGKQDSESADGESGGSGNIIGNGLEIAGAVGDYLSGNGSLADVLDAAESAGISISDLAGLFF